MARRNSPGQDRKDYANNVLKDEYDDVIRTGAATAGAGLIGEVGTAPARAARNRQITAAAVKEAKGKADVNQLEEFGKYLWREADRKDLPSFMKFYDQEIANHKLMNTFKDKIKESKVAQEVAKGGKEALKKFSTASELGMAAVGGVGAGMAVNSLNKSRDQIAAAKGKIDEAKQKNAILQSKKKRGK